jgi:hypothetical protein
VNDGAIWVAIIALIGSVLSTIISLWGQYRTASLTARREAEAVLAKYREPLVAAAFELQGRLFNILRFGFLRKYLVNGDEAQKTYAVENTLYVVAQYFGWSEILRREIQFLSFSDSQKSRAAARCQRRIVELFQSDDPELGRPFLIWRGEQRAIGERMIATANERVECLGYASFLERRDPEFRRWFGRLEGEINEVVETPNRRLIELQNALVDLIRELDPQSLRYSDEVLEKVYEAPSDTTSTGGIRASMWSRLTSPAGKPKTTARSSHPDCRSARSVLIPGKALG